MTSANRDFSVVLWCKNMWNVRGLSGNLTGLTFRLFSYVTACVYHLKCNLAKTHDGSLWLEHLKMLKECFLWRKKRIEKKPIVRQSHWHELSVSGYYRSCCLGFVHIWERRLVFSQTIKTLTRYRHTFIKMACSCKKFPFCYNAHSL